jgi:hypothetical protein
MANFIEIDGLDDEDIKLLETLAKRLKKRTKAKGALRKGSEAATAKDVLMATAGGWKDTIDCEELKRRIYEDRLLSTRPEVRL